jgi:hypothetical protein
VQGYSVGDPPYLSAIALGYAYEILTGHHKRTNLLDVPLSVVTSANSKEGLTWWPGKVAPGFYADVVDTGAHPIVSGLCLEAATTGKACHGSLEFHFPG